MYLVHKNCNLKACLENYRKILTGKISLDLDQEKDEKEHIKGFIKLGKDPKIENISCKNVILRESTLRITDWMIGMVVLIGEETFIARCSKIYWKGMGYGTDVVSRLMIIFIIFIIIFVAVILFYIFEMNNIIVFRNMFFLFC